MPKPSVSERETAPLPAEAVLVVDDDPDFLECLSLELGRIEGIRIEAVDNPLEAINRLSTGQYRLVVSDWVLSPTTGPALMCKADANKKEVCSHKTPVVFISGSDRVALTRRIEPMQNFFAVSFIHKRTGPSIISRMVEEILRGDRLKIAPGSKQ
jgi:CheY-like chemotaxis protein